MSNTVPASAAHLVTRPASDEVLRRVNEFWDLSGDLPVPRPTSPFRCPACQTPDVVIRQWVFHERERATFPGRCDVHVKCTRCSHVWRYGVIVPDVQSRSVRPKNVTIENDAEQAATCKPDHDNP